MDPRNALLAHWTLSPVTYVPGGTIRRIATYAQVSDFGLCSAGCGETGRRYRHVECHSGDAFVALEADCARHDRSAGILRGRPPRPSTLHAQQPAKSEVCGREPSAVECRYM